MAYPHRVKKKRKSSKGKFFLVVIALIVGSLAFMAMQDVPPPTKTISKTLTHPALSE